MPELKQLIDQYYQGRVTLTELTDILEDKLISDPQLVKNIENIQNNIDVSGDDDKTVLNNDLTRVVNNLQEKTVVLQQEATRINQGVAIKHKVADFDASRQRTLAPGDVLKDRFVLEEVIGRGGMSVVFKARDKRKDEANDKNPFVAMKVLGSDFKEHPESFIVLQRETQKAQKLAHPNIVTVYDFDRDGDTIYMTMEQLQGKSLDQVIKEHPAGMSIEEAAPIIEGMSHALAYAHKKDIIHSDFKPGNVFVTDEGVVKVLDFGIARAKNVSGDFDAGDLGALTPAYASTEMFKGEAPDPSDDIYALACMTYELLTGHHPYKRTPADKALQQNLEPKRINNLNPRRWLALRKGLALTRESRTATIEEFSNGILPKQTSKVLLGALATAAIMAMATGYFYYKYEQKADLPVIELSAEQQSQIQNHLETAELYIELGQLATPPGDSAFDIYEKILKIDPTNQMATEGKDKIADRYYSLAESEIDNGNKSVAIKYIETGLQVQPSHDALNKLKSNL